jgi:hypothetical protein
LWLAIPKFINEDWRGCEWLDVRVESAGIFNPAPGFVRAPLVSACPLSVAQGALVEYTGGLGAVQWIGALSGGAVGSITAGKCLAAIHRVWPSVDG